MYVYNAFLHEAVGFMILSASFPHYLNVKHVFLLCFTVYELDSQLLYSVPLIKGHGFQASFLLFNN